MQLFYCSMRSDIFRLYNFKIVNNLAEAEIWGFAKLFSFKPRHVISHNSVGSDEPVQPPFKLKNSKWFSVSSLTDQNIQATSKGYNQTACLCRLMWGFAGRTYNIVGNRISRLICIYDLLLNHFPASCAFWSMFVRLFMSIFQDYGPRSDWIGFIVLASIRSSLKCTWIHQTCL